MAEEKVWRPLDLIKVTADYLGGRGVPSPRLDAEILLCEILGLPRRVDLYAGFEREISGKELAAYREVIRRRAAREPVSRILGRREFMGLTFRVTPDVLSPRPETELLVEAVLELLRPKPVFAGGPEDEAEPETATADGAEAVSAAMAEEMARLLDSYGEDIDDPDGADEYAVAPPPRPVAAPRPARPEKPPAPAGRRFTALDLGTGSGCIAVALAAHCPQAAVTAVDASPKALAVAKRNAADAGVEERVSFRLGDWFAGCRDGEKFDVILSNPPYLVKGDEGIWPEVSQYDPPAALYGGHDGLDCYRRLVPDAADWLAPEGWIFLEVGDGQAERVSDLLRGRGFRAVATVPDYAGVGRIVKAMAPE